MKLHKIYYAFIIYISICIVSNHVKFEFLLFLAHVLLSDECIVSIYLNEIKKLWILKYYYISFLRVFVFVKEEFIFS